MDYGDGFGLGVDEIFVAAFVFFAAKVFCCQVLDLQVGAHCAVEDDDGARGVVEAIEEQAFHGRLKKLRCYIFTISSIVQYSQQLCEPWRVTND